MNQTFFLIGLALLLMMFITIYRAVLGPTTLDRLVCINMLGTKTIVLLIIIGFLYGRVDFLVDLALTYAFLGFLGTVAVSRYLRININSDKRNNLQSKN